MEEAGQGVKLERAIFHNIPGAAPQTRHYFFVSFSGKRIYFDFRMNYLHSEVNWPIKTKSKHLWDAETNLRTSKSYFYLGDFGLD